METVESNLDPIEKIEKVETAAATEPPTKAGSKRTLEHLGTCNSTPVKGLKADQL